MTIFLKIIFFRGIPVNNWDVVISCFYFRYACSIELHEMFLLTGGFYTLTTVSRYSTSGWMEDLPELNEVRADRNMVAATFTMMICRG